MRIPSGVTDQVIYFVGVDATDKVTRETGLSSFTVYRDRNGGGAAAMTTPTITEVDGTNMPGVYKLLADEDMTIGSGNDSEEMVFHITHAGMEPVTRVIELYRSKITAGYTLGVGSDGDLLEVNALTGHTAQTGDSYAVVTGDHGLVSIQDDVDAILADTNELQGDWANGGRLDTLLDGAASAGDPWTTALPGAYGAGTAGLLLGTTIPTAIADIPTNAELALRTLPSADYTVVSDLGTVQTADHSASIAAILEDTGTTLDGKINTIDTVVDRIEVDTQDLQTQIGVDGAGLTDLPAVTLANANQTIGKLTISGGIVVTQSNAGEHGVTIAGGTGDTHGILTSGAGSGSGLTAIGSGSGNGIYAAGDSAGMGILAVGGDAALTLTAGIYAKSLATSNPVGVYVEDGAIVTNDHGTALSVSSTGNNGNGLQTVGNGTGLDIASDLITEARLSELDAGTAGKMANQVDEVRTDTEDLQTQIGSAGAGLTNINLPNQTMDIIGNITGNLSGSVGSVTTKTGFSLAADQSAVTIGTVTTLTGHTPQTADHTAAIADIPTNAELATAVANVSVDEIQATAIADLFNTDSGTTYAAAIAGSVVKEIADNAGGSALTASGIADAVWDETVADHAGVGSTGAALAAAGGSGDPWATALPGAYGSGTAGKIIGDNINAPIATVDTVVDSLATELAKVPKSDSNVTFNATALASINTQADLALSDYDPPTRAELTSDTNAIIAQVDANETKIDTIDTVVDGIQTDLSNGTDGLGALKTILDVIATDTTTDIPATLATIAGYLDTEIATILEDTGTTIPGLISGLNNISAADVWSAVTRTLTANTNLNDLTVADIIAGISDGTYDLQEMLRIMFAILAGHGSGGGSPTVTYKDPTNVKSRIVATVDEFGNRTPTSYDGS